MSQQPATQTETSWMNDAKSLLSSLINHTHAQPLINSFYDENNTNSAPINNKIYLKQIQHNLTNHHYQSIDTLFDDISDVFNNALKILDNSQNIVPIQQTFIEYMNSYQKQNKQNHPDFNHNKQFNIPQSTSTKQTRKTRMHSNTNILTPKRRRSARLKSKMKNNDSDSDDYDININDKRKKKRSFSAIIDETTINTSNKVARTALDHTSPRMDLDFAPNNVKISKKRNRRPRRRKNNKNTTNTIDIGINNKNEDEDDVDMEQTIIKYNLRSQSKTPIAPKIIEKPSLSSSNNTEIIKESSVDSSVVSFSDGTQSSLCGTFESITNMKYSCSALCINGDFKPFNQDWISLDRFDQFKNENAVIVCGVYDGHGILGHNSSKYCARHLPKEFIFELYDINRNKTDINSISTATASIQQNEEKEDESVTEHNMVLALRNALHRIDNDLKEISRNESQMFSTILQRQGCDSRLIDYGTTVNCLVSDGYDAFVVNVGDSRCLLIEGYNDNNKWRLRYKQISSDHNPFKRKDEIERVAKANGQFFKQNEELRLYPKDTTFKEARRKGLAINMTRAIGHSTLSQYGLIANPECYHIKIECEREYIFVMASDGIWDILSNEQVFESVQSIYNSFRNNQTKEIIERQIAMELLETAETKWRNKRVGDNISVVVTRIVKSQ